MKGGFPNVAVDDLVVHPRDNDLVVGTHGRAIYILDDLTALEQLTSEVLDSSVHLFDVRTAYQYLPWKHESYGAQRQFIGENPPEGAIISYYLDANMDSDVNFTILDSRGQTVRKLKAGGQRGVNRSVWDLRSDLLERVARARGPLVSPGTYTVRLELGETRLERGIDVQVDPRAEIAEEELRARYDFLVEIGELLAKTERAGQKTTLIGEQMEKLLERQMKDVPESLGTALKEVLDECHRIRDQLVGADGRTSFQNPSLQMRLRQLFQDVDGDEVRQGTWHGPTSGQREGVELLKFTVEEQLELLNRILEVKIPDLNQRIEEAKLPWIRVQ
jgi:hypothetical protein